MTAKEWIEATVELLMEIQWCVFEETGASGCSLCPSCGQQRPRRALAMEDVSAHAEGCQLAELVRKRPLG